MRKKFDQKEFENFILNNKVIGFFKKPILLKSKRLTHYYINWRNVTQDVFLIDKLSDYIISFVKQKKIDFDCFYGVPEASTKLALIAQYKFAKNSKNFSLGSHCLPMGRKYPKDHGEPKDRYFIGAPKGKVLILEDVATTGSSIFETLKILKKIKVKIVGVLVLTNRMEKTKEGISVKEKIEKKGISFFEMSNVFSLLPKACKKFNPKKEIIREIERYYQNYGIEKLKLL